MLSQDRFTASAAWKHASEARRLMNESKMPPEKENRDALAHVGGVLELLESRRGQSDPREISPNMLAALTSAASILPHHIELANNGSIVWVDVVSTADQIIDTLASWPPLKIAHYLSGMSSATQSFLDKTTEAMRSVDETADKIRDNMLTLEQRQEELDSAVRAERQRISEAVATFTNQAGETLSAIKTDQEEQFSSQLSSLKSHQDSATEAAQDSVAAINRLEAEARNVVHATTSHIVATDYGRYARNKTWAAWICDIGAALVGATGLGVLVFHLLSLRPEADANLGLSLTRVAVSLGTLGVATLLGRRGQQHHLEARAAKRTDLALRQVLPFTANLDEAERREIIREFTNRVFIKGDIDLPKTPGGASPIRQSIITRRAAKEEVAGSGAD
ncbi:hypothetical protein ABXZ31_01917 [Clavibacter nebraskensis]